MKRSLITLCASLVLLSTYGQEHLNNFEMDGNGVTWQKTFVSILEVDQMKELFAELDAFESISVEKEDRIAGQGKPIPNGYMAAGYSEKSAEKWLVEKDLYGKLQVEFQEGRYRVTLSDIQLQQKRSTKKVRRGDLDNLATYVYDAKKGEWEKDFLSKGGAKVINTTLLSYFELGAGGQDF